jgi:hypothetical protein
MPAYKNNRAGAIHLDALVQRDPKDESKILKRAEPRLIGPGDEFNAEESEVPKSWLQSQGGQKPIVEKISDRKQKVLRKGDGSIAHESDLDLPTHADVVGEGPVTTRDDGQVTKNPLADVVGGDKSTTRGLTPEQEAANARAEAEAAKNQTDKVAGHAKAEPKADKHK